ncbi:MAG: sodium/proline symporter [Parachlamydia sp.]|jgi:sodium/proline symporter|nr:sodium/proline symporter [Parachlamydia sp.]
MYLAIILYFSLLTVLVVWSSQKVQTSSAFILGDRSLNYWLTAMAAHASDMGSWLFMAYPSLILVGGLFNAWIAIGLIVCMWLNWQFVAKKFRTLTGKWNCSTFSSFLHHRYDDKSGLLQLFSALFCFGFYVVYLCAHLTGLGILGQTLLGFSYTTSILLGLSIVVVYVSLGGFVSLAWIDLVQGIFLLGVLCAVPCMIIMKEGGVGTVMQQLSAAGTGLSLVPQNFTQVIAMLTMFFGWGLGYFGQPHIITKFMGIRNADEISSSRNVGITWMVIMLAGATLVGLTGIAFFKEGLADPQMVFIEMTKQTFHPFAAGLILCAILAATINVMSSQLLILSSILTEDIYKRFFHQKEHTPRHLLNVSRAWVFLAAFLAFCIAYQQMSSINDLVQYAWSGLGASFGALILVALYSSKVNRYGAMAAIIVGGLTSALWPYANAYMTIPLDSLIPGFCLSLVSTFAVSAMTSKQAVCTSIHECQSLPLAT